MSVCLQGVEGSEQRYTCVMCMNECVMNVHVSCAMCLVNVLLFYVSLKP